MMDIESANLNVDHTDLITVYPNPTVDYLQLEIDESVDQDTRLVIYSSSGQAVLRRSYNRDAIIDVGHLSTGQYVLEIKTRSESYTYQFIKLNP